MSQVKLLRFRVEFTDATTTDLQVIPADRMRAERESTALLLPSQRDRSGHPEVWALLWLWCAAVRTGLTAEGFDAWTLTVSEYGRLTRTGELVGDDTEADEADEPVDPTRPEGPTGTPSSLPPTSGTSPAGWTPTPTPA